MQSWELFALFPKGSIEKIAARLHRSRSLIERWFREPDSDENPNGTGDPNPIDRLDSIVDLSVFVCPEFLPKLIEYYLERYEAVNRVNGARAAEIRSRLHAVESKKRKAS